MKAVPAATFIVPKAEFLFEVLVITLDPPAQFGEIDQRTQAGVGGQGGEPVLGGLWLACGPFDQAPSDRGLERLSSR
jgi:hypothetical protein